MSRFGVLGSGSVGQTLASGLKAHGYEPLCILWCIPGFRENDWSHAFRLLRKS